MQTGRLKKRVSEHMIMQIGILVEKSFETHERQTGTFAKSVLVRLQV